MSSFSYLTLDLLFISSIFLYFYFILLVLANLVVISYKPVSYKRKRVLGEMLINKVISDIVVGKNSDNYRPP